METPRNIQEGKRKIIASLADIDDEARIRVIQNMVDYSRLRTQEYASESLAQYHEPLRAPKRRLARGILSFMKKRWKN